MTDLADDLILYAGGEVVGWDAGSTPYEELPEYYQEEVSRIKAEIKTNVCWVTDYTVMDPLKSPYMAYGNEASPAHAYGHVCLVAKVGPVGRWKTVSEEDTSPPPRWVRDAVTAST